MSKVGYWGVTIAKMLFDQKMTVDQVFERLNVPWQDEAGNLQYPDPEALRRNILVVKEHPERFMA